MPIRQFNCLTHLTKILFFCLFKIHLLYICSVQNTVPRVIGKCENLMPPITSKGAVSYEQKYLLCKFECDKCYRGALKKVYQYSSVAQSCLTLCDPMDCSSPGLPVHHQLLENLHFPKYILNVSTSLPIYCLPQSKSPLSLT